MRMKSKGFEIQFHWVFILIAGALILSFFVMIAQKQLIISKTKQEITVWKSFEDFFSNILRNEETIDVISTQAKINVECTKNLCYLKIGDLSKKTTLPIFIPSELKGGKLTLWSKSFNAPFHVTNFLLITSDKVRFVIVSKEDDALKEYLKNNLPKSVNVEFVTPSQSISYQGHDHTRIVFLNTIKKNFSFPEGKLSILKIANNKVFLEDKAYGFSDDHKELMLAALFAKNSQMYETMMKQVFNRVKNIGNVLKEKAKLNQKETCYYDLDIFDVPELNVEDISTLENYERGIINAQNDCPRLY